MLSNKDAAVALATAGITVFACKPDKTPKGPWKDVPVRAAWQVGMSWQDEELPALPVGEHGIVVIDCDVPKGDKPAGRIAFADLCQREGVDLSGTLTVRTPSGGQHVYFRSDDAFMTCTQSPVAGCDTRAVGGYVIGPGAVLPDGRSYQIVSGSWDAIPALPEALARHLKVKGTTAPPPLPASASTASGAVLPIPTDSDRAWATNALASACEIIRAAAEGERNSTLNNQSLGIAEIAANSPGDLEDIGGALLRAALESGLSDHEARATIASAFKKGLANRRKLPSEKELSIPLDGLLDAATATNSAAEAPRPLRRQGAAGEQFPVEALGDALSRAALAISDKIQCPVGMAALSVLGAASLAVQAHGDIKLPASGQVKPLSLFLVSIGDSGERKSAADGEALRGVRLYEKELSAAYVSALSSYRDKYEAWSAVRDKVKKGKDQTPHAMESALRSLGAEPVAPLMPMLTCSEPTWEGLCNLYQGGYPALGLFSDEGGQFVGGHGLTAENLLRTITGLSGLWDGSPIKRVRAAKDSSFVLPGRRLAMHLMMQPGVSAKLLSDATLKDQGFLSRLLVSQPPTMTGMRFQRPLLADTQNVLDAYTLHLLAILRYPPRMVAGTTNELEPQALELDETARLVWNDYADSIERQMGAGGKFEPIKRFANKLPEHATRIAGVLTLFENLACPFVMRDALERGILIANHFADEALRLFDASAVSAEIALAERLLEWLRTGWTEEFIGLVAIYQYGPNAIRDARTAKPVIVLLIEHGWLMKAPAGTVVNGKVVREAWQIIGRTNSKIAE
jgi:hypothetical protein